MKKIFLFAGQGCQFFGMGANLYKNNIDFRKSIDSVDNEVVKLTGMSVRDIIFDKERKGSDTFSSILQTSLAIFMFEYSAAQMMINNNIIPDCVIGSSLGEICSAVISGMMDMKEAVKLLVSQATLLKQKAPVGCMLTVFDDVALFEKRKDVFGGCELVAVNHRQHFVVASNSENIQLLVSRLNVLNINHQILPVDYAFHSSQIECIHEECCKIFSEVNLKLPKCKVLSSVFGKMLDKIDTDYFWNVIRKPIKLKECISSLDDKNCIFIDLSPDGEMAAMMRYLIPENKNVFKISSIFNIEIDVLGIINSIKKKEVHKLNAYVFPGQGSQEKGMGIELFDEFKELTKKADHILGYSIKDLCMNDYDNNLSQTEYTQPALFIVNVLSYLKKLKEGESEPDYLAGHSLGEYAALYASGAIDFETGVKLVKKRGELMARATGGQMAAVVGLTKEQVKKVLTDNGLTEIDMANMNTPTQIVISGYKEDILKASDIFKSHSNCIMYKVLNVSGAFHSRYMQPAMEEFSEYLRNFKFGEFKIPVISNVYARPYKQSELMETLSRQLVSSIQWTDSIRYLLMKGVEEIIQVGPGRAVQGMVKNIIRDAEPLVIDEDTEAIQIDTITEKANTEVVSFRNFKIKPELLGDSSFINEYNLKYAYMLGGMYKGISGERLVIAAGKAGLMGFFGVGGLEYSRVENAIKKIQEAFSNGEPYGFNMLADLANPEREKRICDLYLRYGVRTVEASAYVTITKSLVKYRIKGIRIDETGKVNIPNRIIAKLSRPEVAGYFMSPPPKKIVDSLLREGEITETEAQLSQSIPMAYDICIEADSGGHTDVANAFVVLPSIFKLRDEMMKKYKYYKKIRIGAAGGIGTPNSAAAAFMMGADFITTGSINQCSVEANTSDAAKDMMSYINVQDTGYVPAWDEFESSSKLQVLKKGTLFHVRGNKLYNLYCSNDSIDGIDEKTKNQIQNKYFKKSFEKIYDDIKEYYDVKVIDEANRNPKLKMALIFKWYFYKSSQWALNGEEDCQSDYQILCGSALGGFNQWIKGSELEDWRNRHVGEIGIMLMNETAKYLSKYWQNMLEKH